MADAFTHANRGPLTWTMDERTDTLTVVCSRGHRSLVQHHVDAEGHLRAPAGKPGSIHCGHCNETMPLDLADWPKGETWTGPRPEKLPPESTCERCGAKGRFLGGWGTWAGGAGLVCPACVGAGT